MAIKKLKCGTSTFADSFNNSNGLTDLTQISSVKDNAMKVMDTPPTIVLGAVNPLAAGQHFGVSNDSVISGRNDISSPNVSIFGGGYFKNFGVSGNQEQVIVSNNVTKTNTPSFSTSVLRISFEHSGTHFAIKLRPNAGADSELLIKVDGEFVTLTPTVLVDDNSIQYASIDFTTYETRRIDIIGYKFLFGNISVGLQDTVVAAKRRGPKLFLIGDSFSDGAGNEIGPSLSYPLYLQESLDIDDLTLSSVGGTGFIRGDGGKANYQFRFQRDIVDLLPTNETPIVWIQASINDQIYTAQQVSDALQVLIDMLTASDKSYTLVVSSPSIADGAGLMPEILIDHNEALRTVTEAAGGRFIDEITMPTGAIPTASTTVTEVIIQDDKAFQTQNNLIPGCNYRFDDGTLFFVRSSVTATRIATVDNVRNAQSNGATVTLVGSTYLTGNGKINFPNGWGNCDFAVSSDSLHPTNFGHLLKGENCAKLFVNKIYST